MAIKMMYICMCCFSEVRW